MHSQVSICVILLGPCNRSVYKKVSGAYREKKSVFLQVVCSTLRIAQGSCVFNSFHVVHVVGVVWCGVVWCGGMGGERILVSGARVVDEVSEGGEVIGIEGSHSLGEKAVEQSGGAGSDALVPSS